MAHISSLTSADQETLLLEFVQEIHAGFPSPAADHAGERIDLVRELSSHPETTFYARVSGDSMHDAGMFDGDIIVIDKSLEPHNGDIIIAAVDGEFTVKEFAETRTTKAAGSYRTIPLSNPSALRRKITSPCGAWLPTAYTRPAVSNVRTR